MFTPQPRGSRQGSDLYQSLEKELFALMEGEKSLLANMANFTALLFHSLEGVNWVGFYLLEDDQLVLGPFQGKPACTRILIGRGVCGTAAKQQEALLVPRVASFPGHIACDADSRSEMVLPYFIDRKLRGVLDLDSPHENRFSETDLQGCRRLLEILVGN